MFTIGSIISFPYTKEIIVYGILIQYLCGDLVCVIRAVTPMQKMDIVHEEYYIPSSIVTLGVYNANRAKK